jgi:hypothetical protein
MGGYAGTEKRGPVDEIKVDVSHGDVHDAMVSPEDDRRVRWKIDCVVLPVSEQRDTAQVDHQADRNCR